MKLQKRGANNNFDAIRQTNDNVDCWNCSLYEYYVGQLDWERSGFVFG